MFTHSFRSFTSKLTRLPPIRGFLSVEEVYVTDTLIPTYLSQNTGFDRLKAFSSEYLKSGKKWYISPRYAAQFLTHHQKLPNGFEILDAKPSPLLDFCVEEILKKFGYNTSNFKHLSDLKGVCECLRAVAASKNDMPQEYFDKFLFRFLCGNMEFLTNFVYTPENIRILHQFIHLCGLEYLCPIKGYFPYEDYETEEFVPYRDESTNEEMYGFEKFE